MVKYRYEVHVVPERGYQGIKIGDAFMGGEVIDGLGGKDNDALLLVAYEVPTVLIGAELLAEIPEGWVSQFCGGEFVIAIHPDHKPRVVTLRQIKYTPFDQWLELDL